MKRLLVFALLAAAVAVPVARADGDPASDYLIQYQVFYPYYSNTPKASLAQLQATVAAANKKGFTIRVAVITSPYDLGSLSALWEKPLAYSRFLALELSFAYKGRLLVVSPKGYGFVEKTVVAHNTASAKAGPASLALVKTIPIGTGTDGLLLTADKAVRALAGKAGIKLAAPKATSSSGSGGSSDTIVIAAAAAVGAALIAGVEVFRRRRRRRPSAEPA
ncbi:MAG TPA: hypothetical protein VLJ76_06610 [Gaiellaceae bacterium]|nr:hypothetical protein [Gaiellaceae bacterium]